MSGEELETVRVVYVRVGDDGLTPAFVIDGRDYASDADVRRAVEEAWDALEERRIVAEFESRSADDRPPGLPTWDEYRETLTSPGGSS